MAFLHPLPLERIRLRDLLSKLPKLTVTFPQPLNLERFTLFPKLPIELRLKIRGYAACEPRSFTWENPWAFWPGNPGYGRIIDGKNQLSSVLQTCNESRSESLKHYTACTMRCVAGGDVHNTLGHVSTLVPCPQKLYVNFNIDRFLRPDEYEPPDTSSWDNCQLEEKDLGKIQLLDMVWPYPDVEALGSLEIIRVAKQLRELNLILSSYTWDTLHHADGRMPNTLARELLMLDYERKLKKDVEQRRKGNWDEREVADDTADDWQLLKGVKLGYKWTILPEEFDLPPIAADTAPTYSSAGGCCENMLRWEIRDEYGRDRRF
jgi:hypothetical protein